MKYSQGFASSFHIKHLFVPLYYLSVIVSTLTIFCVHFFPLVSHVKKDDKPSVLFHVFIGFADNNSDNYLKMVVGQIPYLAVMLILYIDVQNIKKKFRKKFFQYNILTFNQNFYFYIFYISALIISFLIRINIRKLGSGENAELILVYSYLIVLFIDWFLRPIAILILLRKNFPDFLEDFGGQNQTHSFIMKGVIVVPRQQTFMAFRPFRQNARWGSSKKFVVFTGQSYQKTRSERSIVLSKVSC